MRGTQTCEICGEIYFTWQSKPHVCPPAWNVRMHQHQAHTLGFAANECPAKTIHAATMGDAVAAFAEWVDKEHLDGDLIRNEDRLWVYVQAANDPDAKPVLLLATARMVPEYDCHEPRSWDKLRCTVRGCKEPVLADDHLCAAHRAQEDKDTALIAPKPVQVEDDGEILYA